MILNTEKRTGRFFNAQLLDSKGFFLYSIALFPTPEYGFLNGLIRAQFPLQLTAETHVTNS
jgi:hypothetical protein